MTLLTRRARFHRIVACLRVAYANIIRQVVDFVWSMLHALDHNEVRVENHAFSNSEELLIAIIINISHVKTATILDSERSALTTSIFDKELYILWTILLCPMERNAVIVVKFKAINHC